jgi:hypothetical protein
MNAEIRLLSNLDLLTQSYNAWRAELFERAAMLKEGEVQKQRNPKRMIMLPNGQKISILQMVEAR